MPSWQKGPERRPWGRLGSAGVGHAGRAGAQCLLERLHDARTYAPVPEL